MTDDYTVPPTPIEVAEALNCIKSVDPVFGLTMRRLSYQHDLIRDELDAAKRVAEDERAWAIKRDADYAEACDKLTAAQKRIEELYQTIDKRTKIHNQSTEKLCLQASENYVNWKKAEKLIAELTQERDELKFRMEGLEK